MGVGVLRFPRQRTTTAPLARVCWKSWNCLLYPSCGGASPAGHGCSSPLRPLSPPHLPAPPLSFSPCRNYFLPPFNHVCVFDDAAHIPWRYCVLRVHQQTSINMSQSHSGLLRGQAIFRHFTPHKKSSGCFLMNIIQSFLSSPHFFAFLFQPVCVYTTPPP